MPVLSIKFSTIYLFSGVIAFYVVFNSSSVIFVLFNKSYLACSSDSLSVIFLVYSDINFSYSFISYPTLPASLRSSLMVLVFDTN